MMNDNKRDLQDLSTNVAGAVLWLAFAVVGIIAIAAAIRVGMWILGVQ